LGGKLAARDRVFDLRAFQRSPTPRLLLECVEEQTAGLAERVQAAVDAHPVQLLAAAAVDFADLEAGRDVPDVDEGDLAELAAPLHGDADAVEEREQHVGDVLAHVEARVGALPHAVHGVRALGLRKHIFEGDLKMVIDVVGITVDKIKFRRHFERLR